MDGDFDAPVPGAPSPARDGRDPGGGIRTRDTHRRTRLHWDTSNIQVKRNSVWALVEEDEELHQMCDAIIDDQEFASLFQTEIKAGSPLVGNGGMTAGGGGTRNVVQVIDPKRANNGGIILARLRMSYDDLAQAVERM